MVLSLTAAQVADRAGVGRDTLRKLENGDPTVGLGITLAVLKVLGQAGRMVAAIDPLSTDLGRARAAVLHRQRAPAWTDGATSPDERTLPGALS